MFNDTVPSICLAKELPATQLSRVLIQPIPQKVVKCQQNCFYSVNVRYCAVKDLSLSTYAHLRNEFLINYDNDCFFMRRDFCALPNGLLQ